MIQKIVCTVDGRAVEVDDMKPYELVMFERHTGKSAAALEVSKNKGESAAAYEARVQQTLRFEWICILIWANLKKRGLTALPWGDDFLALVDNIEITATADGEVEGPTK